MHPVAKEYVAKGHLPPNDPFDMDLTVHRVPGQRVYTVIPFSVRGAEFVCAHAGVGSVHGDVLLVPMREIFPFMNELFDQGLKVV